MRRRPRVDANHADIVEALRRVGCGVWSLAAHGRGCPDLLVWSGTRYHLLELKCAKGSLTPDQTQWLQWWPGPVAIVRSVEEALRVCKGVGLTRGCTLPSQPGGFSHGERAL